jgi:hypothetical protein
MVLVVLPRRSMERVMKQEPIVIKITQLQKELLEDIIAESLQNLKEMQYRKTILKSLNSLLDKLDRA